MAAKSSVPTFNTLKECLEFLYWLNDNKQKVVRGQLASRLKRLLEKIYKNVNPNNIESALSQFLTIVTNFHKKLCKTPKAVYTGERKTKPTLNSLLQCIPKILATLYFLKYHVDAGFTAMGGGGWKDDVVGMVELYAAIRRRPVAGQSKLDDYLIATADKNTYGVIPGGFDAIELKKLGEGDYSEGRLMTKDLISILNKVENVQNYFLDVYSTTVVGSHGSDIANVANALRLVRDFCKIFGEVNEADFKMHLYSKEKCIEWQELKDHCNNLIKPLDNIFKRDRFSFTGYARDLDGLNKTQIAKKMASWFKNNLEEVKNNLAKIKFFSSKNLRANMRNSRGNTAQLQKYYADLGENITKHLIPYGFTFDGKSFRTGTSPYENLKTHWDGVIKMLCSKNDGLDKLKQILHGKYCPLKKEEEEDVEEPEPEDENLQDEESVKLLATKTEATETEAKPVITKSDADSPPGRKADGTSNQGKKAEGAQNQGKKAEGAQNQGKKAEGAQNQGKKAEGAPVGDDSGPQTAAPSQPSSISSADSPSSGASGSSSGQGQDGQTGGSVSGQRSGQESRAGTGDSNTGSSVAGSVSGDGGDGGGGSATNKPLKHSRCPKGNEIDAINSQGYICQANQTNPNRATFLSAKTLENVWNAQKRTQEGYTHRTVKTPDLHSRDPRIPTRSLQKKYSGPSTQHIDGREGHAQPLPVEPDPPWGSIDLIGKAMPDVSFSGDTIPDTLGVFNDDEKRFTAQNKLIKMYDAKERRDHEAHTKEIENQVSKMKYRDNFNGYPIKMPKKQLYSGPSQLAKTHLASVTGNSVPVQEMQPVSHLSGHVAVGSPPDPKVALHSIPMNAATGTVLPDTSKFLRDTIDGKNLHAAYQSIRDRNERQRQNVYDKMKQSQLLEDDSVKKWKDLQQKAFEDYLQKGDQNIPLGGQPGPVTGSAIKEPYIPHSNYNTNKLTSVTGMVAPDLLYKRHEDKKKVFDAKDTLLNQNKLKTIQIMHNASSIEGDKISPTNYNALWPSVAAHPPSMLEGTVLKASTKTDDEHNHLYDVAVNGLKSHNAWKQKDVERINKETEEKKLQAEKKFAEQQHRGHTQVLKAADFAIYRPPKFALREIDHLPTSHMDLQIFTRKFPPPQDLLDPVDPDDERNINDIDDVIPTEAAHETIDFTFDDPFSVPAPKVTGISRVPPNPNDFKTRKLNVPLFSDPTKCQNPWSVSTSTSSTDTVQPPTSPPQALDHLPPPKTVREMLHWFVGLNTQGLIGLITEHVKGLLKRFRNDAIEVTGDPGQLTASLVTAKLTETCLYSATVIYKVRHNNDFKAFSTFDFKSEYSKFHYSPDPACLLCQLRDYVYACCHQFQFLKAQCNRDKLSGGWQDCKYGSDVAYSKSPLQSFLTDGWESTFDTHPFDPCNLCLNSRVRMGFRGKDLFEEPHDGSTLSTILTPSCGGSDPLLTLSSYLNCLTKLHGHCL